MSRDVGEDIAAFSTLAPEAAENLADWLHHLERAKVASNGQLAGALTWLAGHFPVSSALNSILQEAADRLVVVPDTDRPADLRRSADGVPVLSGRREMKLDEAAAASLADTVRDIADGMLFEARMAEMRRLERVLEGIRDRRIRRLVGWEHVLYRIRGDAWLLGDLEIVTLADPPSLTVPRWRGYITHRRDAA